MASGGEEGQAKQGDIKRTKGRDKIGKEAVEAGGECRCEKNRNRKEKGKQEIIKRRTIGRDMDKGERYKEEIKEGT